MTVTCTYKLTRFSSGTFLNKYTQFTSYEMLIILHHVFPDLLPQLYPTDFSKAKITSINLDDT